MRNVFQTADETKCLQSTSNAIWLIVREKFSFFAFIWIEETIAFIILYRFVWSIIYYFVLKWIFNNIDGKQNQNNIAGEQFCLQRYQFHLNFRLLVVWRMKSSKVYVINLLLLMSTIHATMMNFENKKMLRFMLHFLYT